MKQYKHIHIYDIDGTLVCSKHRYRTASCGTRIDLEHWRANDIPEKIMLDSLLPLAKKYKRDLKNPYVYTILATARACLPNDANYRYIRDVLGVPNKFIHRQGVDDCRGGAALKIQAIKPLLNLKPFKKAKIKVWEDNFKYLQDMCQALNASGFLIPSHQGH